MFVSSVFHIYIYIYFFLMFLFYIFYVSFLFFCFFFIISMSFAVATFSAFPAFFLRTYSRFDLVWFRQSVNIR